MGSLLHLWCLPTGTDSHFDTSQKYEPYHPNTFQFWITLIWVLDSLPTGYASLREPQINSRLADLSSNSTIHRPYPYPQYMDRIPGSLLAPREMHSRPRAEQCFPGGTSAEFNLQNSSHSPSRQEADISTSYPATASLDPWRGKELHNDANIRLLKHIQQICDENLYFQVFKGKCQLCRNGLNFSLQLKFSAPSSFIEENRMISWTHNMQIVETFGREMINIH